MTMRAVMTSQGRVAMETTGQGPDLLLLHSLLTDKHAFDPIVPALARHWTVNQVDLPGFGESSPVTGDGIDDFASAIGGMLAEGDFDRTTAIAGNGLGGFVGLGTAVHYGDRFDRLLLLGCGATFPPPAKTAFATMASTVAEGGMAAVVDIALRRIFTEEYIESHPDEAEQRRQVLMQTPVDTLQRACLALQQVDYTSRLQEVTNPTLIVTGAEDQATPPSLGEDLARLIPHASFQLLPGVAHAPQLQDPRQLLSAIATFLDLEA